MDQDKTARIAEIGQIAHLHVASAAVVVLIDETGVDLVGGNGHAGRGEGYIVAQLHGVAGVLVGVVGGVGGYGVGGRSVKVEPAATKTSLL